MTSPVASERLGPEERLRRRADYLRCYRKGRRISGRAAVVFVLENDCRGPRLGIAASRKIGNAVVRNKLRRRCREIYRRWPGRRRLPDVDIVFNFKHPAARADFVSLRLEIGRQLKRIAAIGGEIGR